jgi:hypothetical protein
MIVEPILFVLLVPAEIIVSGGMTMPQVIASMGPMPRKNQNIRLNRMT